VDNGRLSIEHAFAAVAYLNNSKCPGFAALTRQPVCAETVTPKRKSAREILTRIMMTMGVDGGG
jgi:hypothetical protein